jgi:hypothetical protein
MIRLSTADLHVLEHLDTARRATAARNDYRTADEIAVIFLRVATDTIGRDDARRLVAAIAATGYSPITCIDQLNRTSRIHLAVRDDMDCGCTPTAGVRVVRAFTDPDAAYEFTTNTEEGKDTYVIEVDLEPAHPQLPDGFDMDYAVNVTHRTLSRDLPSLTLEDIAAAYPAFIAVAQAHADARD